MRRAISCVYWEPKSRTRILSCADPIASGNRLGFNFGPVVGGFLGDDHVVDVALPQTCLGDLNEAGLLLHLGDGAAPTVSHAGAQPADQLVHHSRERAAVRDPPFDPFRHQLLRRLIPLRVPVAAAAHSATAVNCGTPAPATIRVVQMEPGPTPTLIASAPASIRSWTASCVATLPATMSVSGKRPFNARTVSSTAWLWPCAVSTTTTSAPALTSSATRASASSPTPTAAPTRRRPCSSLHASG